MGLCVMAIDDARTENAEGLRNSLHLVGVGMPQRQLFHEGLAWAFIVELLSQA